MEYRYNYLPCPAGPRPGGLAGADDCKGQRVIALIRQTEPGPCRAQLSHFLRSVAVKMNPRSAFAVVIDLDVMPGNHTNACSQRLADGLFGRKALGQMAGRAVRLLK